ncbi:MAG: hypothetical protein SFU98_03725 [Leptospiraceae bacterium]|nr:hypothetical protein [Leptospiraceae bacterium]
MKKFVTSILTILFVMGLTFCGSSETKDPAPEAAPAPAPAKEEVKAPAKPAAPAKKK